MSETYGREDVDVLRVDSESIPSDIGTKPLDLDTFLKPLYYFGLMATDEWKQYVEERGAMEAVLGNQYVCDRIEAKTLTIFVMCHSPPTLPCVRENPHSSDKRGSLTCRSIFFCFRERC